jgi:hypothetical protein
MAQPDCDVATDFARQSNALFRGKSPPGGSSIDNGPIEGFARAKIKRRPDCLSVAGQPGQALLIPLMVRQRSIVARIHDDHRERAFAGGASRLLQSTQQFSRSFGQERDHDRVIPWAVPG